MAQGLVLPCNGQRMLVGGRIHPLHWHNVSHACTNLEWKYPINNARSVLCLKISRFDMFGVSCAERALPGKNGSNAQQPFFCT
eukprot:scaffold1211_cov295-Pavlova_lutheri.AAC.4